MKERNDAACTTSSGLQTLAGALYLCAMAMAAVLILLAL